MKKTIGLIIGMLTAVAVYAVDVKLGWEANPPQEMVEKYVIYQARGTNVSFVPVVTVLGTTNVGVVKNLTPGTYRFVVVAQNGIGNAPPSNEVMVPTNAPTATKNVILLEVK
jgi:hypothetical protein